MSVKLDGGSITTLHCMFKIMPQDSPCRTHDVRKILRAAAYAADPQSAESFDMSDLPSLYYMHFNSPFNPLSPMEKVQTWAAFLIMCAFMMRISEVTYYCFLVSSIKIPQRRCEYMNGIPKKLRITLIKWKSKKVRL